MSVAAERLVAVSPGTWHFGLIHENLNFNLLKTEILKFTEIYFNFTEICSPVFV